MNKILPILFNTEMVRAILDGRKTVTRRICKDGNDCTVPDMDFYDAEKRTYAVHNYADKGHAEKLSVAERKIPICLGDILYVRETWFWCPCWDCGMDTEEGCCDKTADRVYNYKKGGYGCYGYKASLTENEFPSVDTFHPSIHMPKEAARIWLKVTDVRVERLQDITEEQAEWEGCQSGFEGYKGAVLGQEDYIEWTAREEFISLWDSTIKKSDLDRYGWGANPWVWVIEFERCEKPEE